MRRHVFKTILPLFLALSCSWMSMGQTPDAAKAPAVAAIPPLPKEPAAVFAAAAPFYDFSSPALKPWHMKVSYQLYDDNSKPTEQGTFEYWWASAEKYRSSWSRPGMEQTDWHIDGKRYHQGDGPALAFYERKLQSELLNPLPRTADLDPNKIRYDRQDVSIGGVKLPCVMVIPKMPLNGHVQLVPMGMFPTYCFDKEKPVLLASSSFGSTSVLYNKVALVQGMFMPREVAVYEGRRKVLTATVDILGGISASAEALTPAANVVAVKDMHPLQIAPGVSQGHLIKQTYPVYPAVAKDAHVEGKVILKAIIGADGHIHDLEVVEASSPLLVAPAIRCVSQWQYKPYLLDGVPVEVETTINVIFQLSR